MCIELLLRLYALDLFFEYLARDARLTLRGRGVARLGGQSLQEEPPNKGSGYQDSRAGDEYHAA